MPIQKETYIPSQTKRFEISPDPISRARVSALLQTTLALQETSPLIGVSLWGSLSKGKRLTVENKISADMDLTAYYDIDRITHDDRSATLDLIDTGVKRGVTSLTLANDEPEINLVIKGLSFTGWYSISERVREILTGSFSNQDELNSHVNAVGPFFGLDIGGGLKDYRIHFFKDAKDRLSPTTADLYWRTISEKIIKPFERGESGTRNQFQMCERISGYYPSTFIGACEYYGLKS